MGKKWIICCFWYCKNSSLQGTTLISNFNTHSELNYPVHGKKNVLFHSLILKCIVPTFQVIDESDTKATSQTKIKETWKIFNTPTKLDYKNQIHIHVLELHIKHFIPEQYVFSWSTLCNDPGRTHSFEQHCQTGSKISMKNLLWYCPKNCVQFKQASKTHIHIINLTGFYIHHYSKHRIKQIPFAFSLDLSVSFLWEVLFQTTSIPHHFVFQILHLAFW